MIIKMDAITLTCGECGKPARYTDGLITRDCGHVSAPVTADLQATVYGMGTTTRNGRASLALEACAVEAGPVEAPPAEEEPAEPSES